MASVKPGWDNLRDMAAFFGVYTVFIKISRMSFEVAFQNMAFNCLVFKYDIFQRIFFDQTLATTYDTKF